MRLTLRALLNWIHDNLSPEDSALIAQKVSGNEFAAALKNQLEIVTKISDLPALFVLDGTPLGNPNSTAEYLDNVMSSDVTPEFEKFCLHSDVVLGEVAGCHQILSEILNQPPELEEELQKRIHGLYSLYYGTPENLPVETGSDLEVLQDAENLPLELPAAPPRFSRLQWCIWGTIFLSLLLLLALGRNGKEDPGASSTPIAESKQTETLPSKENKAEEAVPTEKEADDLEAAERELEIVSELEKSEPPAETISTPSPSLESPATTIEPSELAPLPASEPTPTTEAVEEEDEEIELEEEENEEFDEAWENEENTSSQPNKIQEKYTSSGEKIGLVTSSAGELLWKQSPSQELRLISPQEVLRTGQNYGSWEGFHPTLKLSYLLEIILLGNSCLRVEASPEGMSLGDIFPEYGRFIFNLSQDSGEGEEFHLVFSSRETSYVRLLPGSRLGVNIYMARGSDPAVNPRTLIELLVLDGNVEIHDGGEVITVDATHVPQGIYWDSQDQDAVLPVPLDSIPLWVVQDQKNAIRENAERVRRLLEQELRGEKSLIEGLHTLAASEGKASANIQRLAQKYLAVLGHLPTLQDLAKEFKSGDSRKAELTQKSLQEILFLSPWHAQQIKSALNADDYQWLWEE